MEQAIRTFALDLGVDDVGFASALAYDSPRSYPITRLMPEAKSIIVLAFRVLSSCESPSRDRGPERPHGPGRLRPDRQLPGGAVP